MVGKLLKGTNKFLELYKDMDLEETKTTTYVDPRKKNKKAELPFPPREIKKKLKKIRTQIEEEDDKEAED